MFINTQNPDTAAHGTNASPCRRDLVQATGRFLAITVAALVVASALLPRDDSSLLRPLGEAAESASAVGRAATQSMDASGTATTRTYMLYHGGLTQTSPHIYIIYWGNWTSGDSYGVMNRLYYFFKGVGGSRWNATVTGYGSNCTVGTFSCPSSATMITNPANQLKGYWNDTRAVPSIPTQAQLAAEANQGAYHFNDWSPNAQFIVATAHNHGDADFRAAIAGQKGGSCAWHSSTWSNSHRISYTNLPYIPDAGTHCGMNFVNAGAAGFMDGVTIVAGHEYAESETNPLQNAWYAGPSTAQDENGDLCNGPSNKALTTSFQFSTGTFAIQATWSNYDEYYYGTGCAFWT